MRSSTHRRTKGLATLEAALIIPFLLMITFAALEYGWMFVRMQQVNNAARAGARIAVLPDATNAQVAATVQNLMNAADIVAGDYQLTLSSADISALSPGDIVTATVVVPYANVMLMGMAWHPLPTNLQASVSMTKEGP